MITPFIYFGIQAVVFLLLMGVTEVFGRSDNGKCLYETKEMALDLSLGFAIACFVFSFIASMFGVFEIGEFSTTVVPIISTLGTLIFIVFKILEKCKIIVI